MRASKIGIEVSKPELTALLTFAGTKEKHDLVYFGIRRRGGKLVASATDGHRAIEITSESDASEEHVVGEWHVARAFLEGCQKILDGERLCMLLVNSSGLRKARIMDVESFAERATVSWHEEAASTQVTMDKLAGIIQDAKLLANYSGGSWFALQGRYLAEMQLVSKACSKAPITIYPPTGPLDPMYFETQCDGARWRGVIMPVRVEQPGGLAEEDDEPDDIGQSKAVREAVDHLKDVLEENGATLTVHEPKGDADDGVVDDDYQPDAAEPPLKTQKKVAKRPATNAPKASKKRGSKK